MLKKANKITALLVAAAAVVSVAPATAVSAATTKLGTKDGYFDDAVVFNGKYIYNGYKNDKDGNEEDKAVYFNNGEKDSKVNEYDDDDYDFTGDTYGDKYGIAKDGDDEYLVDMTSGKVTDDTVKDKKEDTAQALEKAIKKTDKFDGEEVDDKDLKDVPAYGNFQAPYYAVEKDGKTILTDEKGKYVTADKTANVYYYSSKRDKVVKIENFNNDETKEKDKYDSDSKLGAKLNSLKLIGQDKDYVYAIANVDVTDTNADHEGSAAKVAVDFSNAVTAKDTAAKYEITYTTSDAAAGSEVTYDGKTYKAGTDSLVDLYGALKSGMTDFDVNTKGANKIIAVAKKTGEISQAVTGRGVSFTNGAKSAAATGFKVATKTYTKGTDYTDVASLKNKVAADFTQAANVPAGFKFDVNDYTFTKTAAGDLTDAEKAAFDGSNVKVTDGTTAGAGKTVTVNYLQKISKAQGDKDKQAYLPKSVASYLMDDKSVYDNGDVNDASNWLLGNDGDYSNDSIINVQADGNSLYVYRMKNSDDKVKVLKIDLKNIKENRGTATKGVGDDKKLDGYVVKKDGDTDQDADSYDVDSNGILWVLHDGNIIKFSKKDKDTVYKVDSGMKKLFVYDEKNLAAYTGDEDNKIYTTVAEGKKQTVDDGTALNPVKVDTTGTKWDKQADGTYKYMENGAYVTGWKSVDGKWYYMDPTTQLMKTGWIQPNGAGTTWYYCWSDGSMATGWQKLDGIYYYLEPVNNNGGMKTGWFQDYTGTWYYCDENGHMLHDCYVGQWRLGSSGAWVK